MKPRDPIAALLYQHRDAARAGAWDAGVPVADLDDVAQEALLLTWRRITAHTLTLPGEEDAAIRVLRTFLRQTAFHIGRHVAKRLRREEVREDAGKALPPVNPEPMLDARAALRELVDGAGIREIERGMPLDVYVMTDRTVSETSLATRRYRLRGGRRNK